MRITDDMLARALADIHDLQMRVRTLEHFVQTRVPLALLRAAEQLGEKYKIPSQRTLGTLEHEFNRLSRGEASGTSADPSVRSD